jgi:uncharacterized protein YggE
MIADRNRFVQHLLMKRFLFLFLAVFPTSVFAEGGLPDKPYIYVEGKAEIQKQADLAILTFDLVVRAADQTKANEQLQSDASKILALLNSRKIAENDVIAESLTSEPEFEQEETYPRRRGKLIDYRVTRNFRVKVRDVTAFPKLVNDLLAMGDVEFSNIESGLSKEKEVENQIWEKAIANARERADKTVKAMGMKIDTVFAVSPVAFPELQSKVFGMGQGAGVTAEVQRVIEPGLQYRLAPITVSQSVHVIYLISPAK